MATFRWPAGWDPLTGLRLVQRELERLTGVSLFEGNRVGGGNYPPVNVYSGPDDVLVECEVPGIRREDLDISITGETLEVKGVKRASADEEKVRFQRRERGMGDFSRMVVLPDRIDVDKVEASLADGILTIRLPKSESARSKKVAVK